MKLAERSSCLDGANAGGRCLRKAKGRPGFITAKEPGLQQPNKAKIWTLRRLRERRREGMWKRAQGQQLNRTKEGG